MRNVLTFFLLCSLMVLFAWHSATPAQADEPPLTFPTTEEIEAADTAGYDEVQPICGLSGAGICFDPENNPATTSVECVDGMAGIYPCSNVDLEAFLPLADLDSSQAASLWGYTDEDSGREFALIAMSNGTVFVEITDAENPVYLGKLPTHTGNSLWRELKTYQHYAFVVSDSNGAHGIQVFDLDQLLNVQSPPVTFTETAHYAGVNSVHNIVIDTQSGFAFAVGSNSASCGTGLHMVDIRNPLAPTYAGCYSGAGYVHDAQCLTYPGPDTDHIGKEICITSDVDAIHVVDVTNKAAPVQISTETYANPGYIHQSWLTPDNQYMVLDDELDNSGSQQTTTFIWDMRNLDDPMMTRRYLHPGTAIDHNQYTKDQYVFQANYRAGLRVFDASDIANANMTEIGFFDIYPANDDGCFSSAWNVYPYFDSGVVIISGIEQGLFVVRPNLSPTGPTPTPTAPPTGPDINVTPGAFEETHNSPPQTTNDTMNIQNTGAGTLTWTITEDDSRPFGEPNPVQPRDPNAPTHRLGAADGTGTTKVEFGPIVGDGSFETGTPNSEWEEFSTNFGTPLCDVGCGTGGGTGPRTGEWWVWFGGIDASETGIITQTVTIPTGSAELSFWLEIPVFESNGLLSVRMDGTEVFRAEETTTGYPTYAEVTIDISAYADGGAHELVFFSTTDPGGTTNFFVDDVAITVKASGACDAPSDIPWLTVSPTNGSTAGGGSTPVTLTYNSTSLAMGTYTGTLCIASNDADEALVTVPITLNVGPPTAIDLASFTSPIAGVNLGDLAAAGLLLLAGVALLLRRTQAQPHR